MKKLLILFLLCLSPLAAEARSIKLGNTDVDVAVKSHQVSGTCKANADCTSGLCVSGSCKFCGANHACPAGYDCDMGICKEKACSSNSDCESGHCNPATSKCVDCMTDADCQSGSKGKYCTTDKKCADCFADDTACGNCNASISGSVPDGSGGCKCGEEEFQNGSSCSSYCSLTSCKAGKTKMFNGSNGCCCL